MILSFEGIDASGKNTQSRLLYDWLLKSKNTHGEYISFPDYSTTVGGEIRAFLSGRKNYPLEVRHILYTINRYEHKERIENWLDQGRIVVINRYCDSNLAYGGASGLSIEWLKFLESKMPQADYVFYLKAEPSLSKKRKKERDMFEADIAFLERVSSVYSALAETPNWFTVNADDSIENIHYEITKIVENLLFEDANGHAGEKTNKQPSSPLLWPEHKT